MYDDDFDPEDDLPIPVQMPAEPHPAELLPIADRVEIGIGDGHHRNGGIVPFHAHLKGRDILDALTGEERKSVQWHIGRGYKPTVYETRDSEQRLLQVTVRYDHATEPKEIRPLRYCGKGANGLDLYWFSWIPGTKPLFGGHQLALRPDAPVLIVEGEKTATAAGALFPDHVVVTWLSGANAVRRADVAALNGRQVVVWPDNDPTGRRAARLFSAIALKAGAFSAAIVDVPPVFPSKWDLADVLPNGIAVSDLTILLNTARMMSQTDAMTLLRSSERLAAKRRLLGQQPGYSRVDLDAAGDALNALNADMPGNEWRSTARCWFHAYGAAGLATFDTWSRSGERYKEGEPARMWENFAQEEGFSGHPLSWLLRKARKAAEQSQSNFTVDAEAMVMAEMDAMNENHAVVLRGGKTVVMRETFDPRLGQFSVIYLKKSDFADKFVRKVQLPGEDGKPGRVVKLGKLWFDSGWRREYDGVVFAPGGDPGRGNINLWRGFTVTPADNPDGWSLLKEHIRDNIAQGDVVSFNYILNWLAFGVQNLSEPVKTALVLTGPKGAGKSIIAVLYGHLFGEHYFSTAHAGDVLGHFNSHLEYTLALGLEEAVAPESRQQDNVLKTSSMLLNCVSRRNFWAFGPCLTICASS